MKKDIHPEYREVLFHDSIADKHWLIRSTLQTTQTKEWEDGNTYPYFPLDISSASLEGADFDLNLGSAQVKSAILFAALTASKETTFRDKKKSRDHTEIMLSSESKVVTYVNKKGERSTYPLNSAMESAN